MRGKLTLRRALLIIAVLATLAGTSAPFTNALRGAGPESAISAAGMQNRSQLELAIIVNKSNPNDNLSFSELREYFMAERNNWSGGAGKVRVIMREPGVAEREAVLRLIYDMGEKDFVGYFLGKKFRGEILDEPRLRTSTLDMIKTIANVPGAIGYVRADEVDASVKVIRVDGLAPGDAGYKIKQ